MSALNGIPYGPPRDAGIHVEAGGHTVVCTCAWVRWWPIKSDATAGRLKHQKTCKKAGAK